MLQGKPNRNWQVSKHLTNEQFISRAITRHGERYNYDKALYTSAHCKVTVSCSLHGDFMISPNEHVTKGRGCPRCGREQGGASRRQSRYDFIEQATQLHGTEKYKYDLVPEFRKSNKEHIKIICCIHGEFISTYNSHLKGKGCPRCKADAAVIRNTIPFQSFVDQARSKHGNRFSYSEALYNGLTSSTRIFCNHHGMFETTPIRHLGAQSGSCQKCYKKHYLINTQKCVDRFISVHGQEYNYDDVVYAGTQKKVRIICKKHGPFHQAAEHHWAGSKCPSCLSHVSKPEIEIFTYTSTLASDVFSSDRSVITPYELDIIAPNNHLAIEYGSIYHHSDRFKDANYHLKKQILAKAAGYDLLTIFSDEWSYKRDIVRSVIASKLGKLEKGCSGRETTIRTINCQQCAEFLEVHHLQGACKGSCYLGAFDHAHTLVGVMVFGPSTRPSGYEVELKRFSSKIYHYYPGLASKLLAYYLTSAKPKSMVSFSDNRWFSGKMYQHLGFAKDAEIRPDYHYVIGDRRVNKSRFRKSNLHTLYPEFFDASKSEAEIMRDAGVKRVFDCGKTRWLLQRL